MSLLSTTYFGPVTTTVYNFEPSWSGSSSPNGFRAGSFGGIDTIARVDQLQELVTNPGQRITVGGFTGVLEYVYSTAEALAAFHGWYLLESCDLTPMRVGVDARLRSFSLSATYLGDHRQVVVARSARARDNAFSLTPKSLVVDPFWGETSTGEAFIAPGGSTGTREYDNTTHRVDPPTGTARYVTFHSDSVDGAPVVLPYLRQATDYDGNTTPRWVSDRTTDVRAWDRRTLREVYGPSHPFTVPSDITVTNGILRFTVGAVGLAPYVSVEAFCSGTWRQVGCVAMEGDQNDPLLMARLTAVTPESATVVMTARRIGDISVTLKRGERMLRVRHGSTRSPSLSTKRVVRWYGMPPPTRSDALTNPAGKFGTGISVASGDVTFVWPKSVPKSRWSLSGFWLPGSAVASQADSGLLTIWDSAGPASFLEFQASSDKLRWTQNGQVLESAALTFSANDPIFFDLRHSPTGRTLTTRVAAGAVAHVTNGAFTSSGGAEANYGYLSLGVTSTVWFGAGDFGDFAFGSGTQVNGVLDNIAIFDGTHTNDEAAALAGATAGLNALPSPEGEMVFYAPFDSTPLPLGSLLSGGLRYEATAQNGSTRAPDANGLTKALAVLDGNVAAGDGLSVSTTDDTFEVAAFLATTASLDDLADHHSQFAADTTQTIRVRS